MKNWKTTTAGFISAFGFTWYAMAPCTTAVVVAALGQALQGYFAKDKNTTNCTSPGPVRPATTPPQ